MSDKKAYYIPIRKSDIDLGRPLKWSIYNQERALLLKRGCVVETQAQLDRLFEEGLYRDTSGSDFAATRKNTAHTSNDDGVPNRLLSFDEIRVSVGDVFNVQIQADQPDNRHFVRLLGYNKNKSVIITCPEEDDGLVYVKEGQVFVVRFFSGKNAYAFTTSVLRVLNTPYPHLHLSYPKQIKGLVVRQGERVSTKIICSIGQSAQGAVHSVSGSILNLSTGGALIACKKKLGAKDTELLLKFRIYIGDIEYLISVNGKICSVQQDESGEFHQGIRFFEVKPEIQIALTAFVYQSIVDTGTSA